MAIEYDCACGERITSSDDRAGKIEKCPACRMTVLVPDRPKPAAATVRPSLTRGANPRVGAEGPGRRPGTSPRSRDSSQDFPAARNAAHRPQWTGIR